MDGDRKEELEVAKLPAQLSLMIPIETKKLAVCSPFVMNHLQVRLFPGIFFHAIGLMRPGQLHLEAHGKTLLYVEWAVVFPTEERPKMMTTLNLGWK